MKFLFQNLWERKKAVAIVIVLLIAQALCELSLPNYTADIVDVGIQQNGVDSVAVEKMRQETHNWLLAFMDDDEISYLDACYEKQGETYVLKDEVSEDKDKKTALEKVLHVFCHIVRTVDKGLQPFTMSDNNRPDMQQ